MNIPNYIKNNLLLKVTSANTIVVFIRMVFSVITQKVLAILIGAEGIALVGNLKSVIVFFEQFSILGTFNGLVKYISEFKDIKERLNQLFSTILVFAIIAAILSFSVLFFGSGYLNQLVFGEGANYQFIFKILAFIIPFMGVNAVLNSILNGFSDYKNYSRVVVTSVIISTIVIVFLTFKNHVRGSFLAISLIPLIQFFSHICFSSKIIKKYFDFKLITLKPIFKNKLLSYSFMTLIVVLSVSVVDIAVRNLIEQIIGVKDAGYWTAMASVSKTYMQFSAAIFPLYILPKYAKINNSFKFRKEVLEIYKLLLPLFAVGMVLIFIFKDVAIKLLFTEDFLSMSVLFKWQLMGDFVKLVALVIAYQFLAKRQIGYFIFTELLSVILFYVFSNYFIQTHGTEGIVLAHFVRYVIYLVVVLFILRNNFIGKNKVL